MLGIVFVLLVCFLRRGIVGGLEDLYRWISTSATEAAEATERRVARRLQTPTAPDRWRRGDRRRTSARGDRTQRPDPAGDRSDQALWRPARQQRYRFHRQSRRTARHHRPQRRRQVDLLQDADLRNPADLGQDPVRGARHHRQERHRRLPARPDQELSGQPAVHRIDGAREHRSIAALADLRGKFRLDLFREPRTASRI